MTWLDGVTGFLCSSVVKALSSSFEKLQSELLNIPQHGKGANVQIPQSSWSAVSAQYDPGSCQLSEGGLIYCWAPNEDRQKMVCPKSSPFYCSPLRFLIHALLKNPSGPATRRAKKIITSWCTFIYQPLLQKHEAAPKFF